MKGLSNLVELKGITKTFGSVLALDSVDWELAPREVHGLLGGNGAGKTTLMNVLYGLYRQDSGAVHLRGNPVEIRSPRDALQHGVGMVHQHFLQVPAFTVTQNVVLGSPIPTMPVIQLEQARARIEELSVHFGLEVDPLSTIQELPMGVRQRVEILKALYRGVDVLILDEPTTNLTPQEVDRLFRSLRVMVAEGMSVVFITHKLKEVMEVCDRVSVLREGRHILTTSLGSVSEDELVASMVGEDLDLEFSILFSDTESLAGRESPGQDRLEVRDLTAPGEGGRPALDGVSFDLKAGEILGIAGVAGNGQRELAEALINVRPKQSGTVLLDGTPIAELATGQILDLGVAYIPEDRVEDGYLPTASVAHNLILGTHHRAPYARRGILAWDRIYRSARDLISDYNIRTQGPGDLAANLSGGNIQRLMIARAFSRDLKLLLAHNPTSGLDIPSVEFIYRKLLAMRERGLGCLLISDDLDELLLISDRIAVLYRGRIAGLLQRGEFDRYRIGLMMSGGGNDG